MGMSYDAYVLYGLHVPRTEHGTAHVWAEQRRVEYAIDAGRDALPDIHTLAVGNYDRDQLFIMADVEPDKDPLVELGTHLRLDASMTAVTKDRLDSQLARALQLLGYDPAAFAEPGWIVVPDLS